MSDLQGFLDGVVEAGQWLEGNDLATGLVEADAVTVQIDGKLVTVYAERPNEPKRWQFWRKRPETPKVHIYQRPMPYPDDMLFGVDSEALHGFGKLASEHEDISELRTKTKVDPLVKPRQDFKDRLEELESSTRRGETARRTHH